MISYKRYFNKNFIAKKTSIKYRLDGLVDREHYFANSVRTGLIELYRQLNIGENDAVLLPAFSPHGLVLPARKQKINIEYYNLLESLAPDINSIEKMIKTVPSVKAVFFIHYFGHVYDFSDIASFVREKGIIVVEDCAHTLCADFNNNVRNVGMFGDVAFFSFNKILPVPDGALFLVNDTSLHLNPIAYKFEISSYAAAYCNLIHLVFRTYAVRWNVAILSKIAQFFYLFYYKLLCNQKSVSKVSKTTWELLSRLDIKAITVSRSENASKLYGLLNPSVRSHMKSFVPGDISTGIPLVSAKKDIIVRKLRKMGIQTLSYNKLWWFVDSDLSNDFIYEKWFHDNHFALPVSENLSTNDLDIISFSINTLFDEDTD